MASAKVIVQVWKFANQKSAEGIGSAIHKFIGDVSVEIAKFVEEKHIWNWDHFTAWMVEKHGVFNNSEDYAKVWRMMEEEIPEIQELPKAINMTGLFDFSELLKLPSSIVDNSPTKEIVPGITLGSIFSNKNTWYALAALVLMFIINEFVINKRR